MIYIYKFQKYLKHELQGRNRIWGSRPLLQEHSNIETGFRSNPN